ncbi:MAG: GFA family protein [Gammaproteobacteria bacterium]
MSIHMGACHCGICRKWTGGPLMAVDCGTDVSFSGKQHIKIYNSSEWAERGFCKQCGSHLFYRLKENNQHIMMVGLFDNLDDIEFDHQVFVDDKPKFYDFSNQTISMTGEEVFAQFSSTKE